MTVIKESNDLKLIAFALLCLFFTSAQMNLEINQSN